jgi:Beta/Gamma crystallin
VRSTEVGVPFSSARIQITGAAVFMAVAALAGISCVTAVQAAQPPRRPAPAPHPAPVQRAVQRPAPRVAAPRPAPQVHVSRPAPQVHVNRPVTAPKITQPNVNRNLHVVNPSVQHINPGAQHINPGAQHVTPNAQRLNPALAQPKGGLPLQGRNALKLGPGKPVINPASLRRGPGGFQQVKPAFPAVNIHGKFWPIHRERRFIWFGGHRRFFVPVGLLGVALIGGSYWYPDAYVSIEGPACAGFTPDGCQLHWRMVDFEDGGGEPECVQYCPRVGPPPAAAAPLPPPPAFAQNGACQVTIFSEANFAGLSAPTGDSQPDLSQTGWRNEIASIQVQAGTWDFFSDENFGGESMRLSAGPYPILAPEWSKRIGSFMCVQPGPPGA